MIARSSKISHPGGLDIDTPILLPSFSSKGFKLNKKGESEIYKWVEFMQEFLIDYVLISAYDIEYKYVPRADFFGSMVELIFLDSGGYEVSEDHDYSNVYEYQYKINDWSIDKYKHILNNWPDHAPTVFISYDHPNERRKLQDQIKDALELFENYPNQLCDFLIKPETKEQRTLDAAINSLDECIDELKCFNIIGVTEKELGNSLILRMHNISRIRRMLDDASIDLPLHVFGSLDPITTCLYFLSGAEIFDGLTWLRYSYYDGTAIYTPNYGALKGSISQRDISVRLMSFVHNYYYLIKLKEQMDKIMVAHDFNKYDFIGNNLKEHYDLLQNRIGSEL